MSERQTDGHWPIWAKVPGVGIVIGCECGEHPIKQVQRVSMAHCWHQRHRAKQGLAPVEYVWPEGTYRVPGELSRGKLVLS